MIFPLFSNNKQTMTSWAEKVRHEEPILKSIPNPIPLGWIRLKKDKKSGQTIVDQNKDDPYLVEPLFDFDKAMSDAIVEMRSRWEMHHYLRGTYYDYDIYDNQDEYDSETDGDESGSDSDDEQNIHLAGGSRWYEEN